MRVILTVLPSDESQNNTGSCPWLQTFKWYPNDFSDLLSTPSLPDSSFLTEIDFRDATTTLSLVSRLLLMECSGYSVFDAMKQW